ncbi:alpha/beta fold hydrolase [Streptomyces sp. NPDC058086]|uniref:alpha/beta fold hydrolase n=1 Tax=Streptomyces sp. NPDC058086 TaxID=3346334 RepID=UPI0036EA6EF6
MLGALETSDLSGALAQIAAPTLVLCGQRDRTSLPDARRTAAAIPGARLFVVPHAGHLLPTGAPHAFDAFDAFDAFVRGFLAPGHQQTH